MQSNNTRSSSNSKSDGKPGEGCDDESSWESIDEHNHSSSRSQECSLPVTADIVETNRCEEILIGTHVVPNTSVILEENNNNKISSILYQAPVSQIIANFDHDEWEPLTGKDEEEKKRKNAGPNNSVHLAMSRSSLVPYNYNKIESVKNHERQKKSTTRHQSSSSSSFASTPSSTKTKLERPVHVLWSRFLIHFVLELWKSDLNVRIGIVLILIGLFYNAMYWSMWYLYCPRQMIGLLLLIVPILYLNNRTVIHMIDGTRKCLESPTHLVTVLEEMDSKEIRRLSIFCSFVIPLLMEIRTMQLLYIIHSDLGWNVYNLLLSTLLLFAMTYNWRIRYQSIRICIESGLWIFYGSAVVLTLQRSDWLRLPQVAGPFFIPTGTLWLHRYSSRNPIWISQMVRSALQLAVQDALRDFQNMIQNDEMLQITMLRWIVDYWATSNIDHGGSKQNQYQNNSSCKNEASHPNMNQDQSKPNPLLVQFVDENKSAQNQVSSSSKQDHEKTKEPDKGIEWKDLCTMLSTTTDRMTVEIDNNLRNNYHETSMTTQQLPQLHRKASEPDQIETLRKLHDMFVRMDIDETIQPAVRAYKRQMETFPPTQEVAIIISILRRCPTVILLFWQLFFGQFRNTIASIVILCTFISFELLRIHAWAETCKYHCVRYNQTTTTTPTQSSNTTQPTNGIDNMITTIDPMICLLVDDDSYRFIGNTAASSSSNRNAVGYGVLYHPTHLLMVWMNMKHSVTALERGIRATRCVQTIGATAELAGTVLSLVHLCIEISQKGLPFGITVLVKELVSIYAAATTTMSSSVYDVDNRSSITSVLACVNSSDNNNVKYTKAILRSLQYSQIIHQNVSAILADDHHHQLQQRSTNGGGDDHCSNNNSNNNGGLWNTIVHHVFPAIIGRGWLWHDETNFSATSNTTTSTSIVSYHDPSQMMIDPLITEDEVDKETKTTSSLLVDDCTITTMESPAEEIAYRNSNTVVDGIKDTMKTGTTTRSTSNSTVMEEQKVVTIEQQQPPNPVPVQVVNNDTAGTSTTNINEFLSIASKSKWVTSEMREQKYSFIQTVISTNQE